MVSPFPIGIVISQFNENITQLLYDAAIKHLKERGFSSDHIHEFQVPGAVEIPLACQLMIQRHKVEAVIALGAVIRGETDHYDYVCQQVSYGCQRVALASSVPVIFGVLTTQTSLQAMARANGEHSTKGREVVDAAIQMVELMR